MTSHLSLIIEIELVSAEDATDEHQRIAWETTTGRQERWGKVLSITEEGKRWGRNLSFAPPADAPGDDSQSVFGPPTPSEVSEVE